jgi:hypothetical protein
VNYWGVRSECLARIEWPCKLDYDRVKSRLNVCTVLTTTAAVAKSQTHIRNKCTFSRSVKVTSAPRNRTTLIGSSQLRARHRGAESVRRDAESHLLATAVRTPELNFRIALALDRSVIRKPF